VAAFTEKPRSRSTGVRKRAGPTGSATPSSDPTGSGAPAPRSVFNRLYNQAVPAEFRDPDLLRRMAEVVSKRSTPGPLLRSRSAGAKLRGTGAQPPGLGGPSHTVSGLKEQQDARQRPRPGASGPAVPPPPTRTGNVWSRMYDDAVWMPSIQDFEKLVRQRTTAARRQTAAMAAASSSSRPRPGPGQTLKPRARLGAGGGGLGGADNSSTNSGSVGHGLPMDGPTIDTDFEDRDRSGARSQVGSQGSACVSLHFVVFARRG
jgi:hypothetical protein